MLRILLIAAFVAFTSAACPNQCSGEFYKQDAQNLPPSFDDLSPPTSIQLPQAMDAALIMISVCASSSRACTRLTAMDFLVPIALSVSTCSVPVKRLPHPSSALPHLSYLIPLPTQTFMIFF